MKRNKKILLLFFLLLLIFVFFVYYYFSNSSKKILSQKQSISLNKQSSQINSENNLNTKTEEIIKCQNTVVTPGETVELFTYATEGKKRADYRVSATTEEASIDTQILQNGPWLYVWNRPIKYDSNTKKENPPGIKIKSIAFDFKIPKSATDQLERFSSSQFSGDRLCTVWDDVDPVFEIPADFVFTESANITNKIQEDLTKICTICNKTSDESSKSVCRKNLGC